MNRNSLLIATIFWSSVIFIGLSIADDINLDIPKFKDGDCLVWTPPMSATTSVLKIRKLNSITFRGVTARFYEMELNNEPIKIETWQVDIGNARIFDCRDFEKVKAEVDANNKAIEAELDNLNEVPMKPVPQQEAAIPQVKAPQTQLKTSGGSDTNPFWGRVEAIIKSQWEAPPIDVTGQTYSAVIRFRYYRNGTVKDVAVQQTSGNSYFDMASQRAVQESRLPMLPPDITYGYQDLEMVFRVGELGEPK